MHQHPRTPPVTASSARSPQTNPMRSNNQRDNPLHSRQTSESAAPGDQGIYMTDGPQTSGSSQQSNSPEGKLNLIVQNYFYKAALMILDARVALPQAFSARDSKPRVNKWFNTELPETEALSESVKQWKNVRPLRERPPPMTLETYIDLGDLAKNQKLVITDENGKRHDTELILKEKLGTHSIDESQLRRCKIVLERFTCELGDSWPDLDDSYPLNEVLPKVYKGSIVLYRSLYAHLKFMPAWKFVKRASKPHPGHIMPKLRWRIYSGTALPPSNGIDELEVPLSWEQIKATETIRWDPVDSPAGKFSITATYRHNCDFRIDTSESLFNSQFMASDDQWFQPSLPKSSLLDSQQSALQSRAGDMASLPFNARQVPARQTLADIADQGPAYGSMSTFHNVGGRIGTSPLSALRAARDIHAMSPADSPPAALLEHRPTLDSQGSRRSYNASNAVVRRPSISIQPFKSPTYASSVPAEQTVPPSPRANSYSRNSPLAALAEARNPSLSGQHPAQISPRTSPKLSEALPVPAAANSPRPAPSRFSSSFSHRKNRLSAGGISAKLDEDTTSSGRGSASSSSNVQAGTAADHSTAATMQNDDDDNISDFLKMLDAKKELKSFQSPVRSETGGSANRGTTAALNKFHQLRDSHAALSESLSSSQVLQRSSTSSASRQLANVPAMVAGTSASIASSPGDRISPRTPHTPAIPSRLSSNSIIEYNQAERGQRPRAHRFSEGEDPNAGSSATAHQRSASNTTQDESRQMAGAIPIPTSPRNQTPNFRRSNSAAANARRRDRSNRDTEYDLSHGVGDMLPFGMRSASLGDGEERPPLSLSGLVRLQEAALPIVTGVPPPPPDMTAQSLGEMGPLNQDSEVDRANVTETRGGQSVVISDTEQSLTHSQREPMPGSRPSFRHSFARPSNLANFEDDEPLLFAMSEQLEERHAPAPSSPSAAAAADASGDRVAKASGRRDSSHRSGGGTSGTRAAGEGSSRGLQMQRW